MTPPQDAGWVVASTDPECAALSPGSLPPRLSWTGPDGGAACDPATIDGRGDLAASWLSGYGGGTSYFPIDGSAGATIRDGRIGNTPVEDLLWVAPRNSGFLLVSKTFKPWCTFVRPLAPDATPGPAVLVDTPFPDRLELIKPNPLGGYVEMRTTDDRRQPVTATLDVRFVNEALEPLGAWQTVVTYHKNIRWSVNVDQRGRALVLAFTYPPSFGPPPPPSEWKFSARWMGANGPLTDEFDPVAPFFTPRSSDGFVLFAGWGTILPLPEGGFAMFQYQVGPSYDGTISPTGWYAFYASGQSGTEAAPGWLQLYDGSLRLLAGGVGYAAGRREPGTCARTVFLIAPSGRTCFTLALERTEVCDAFPDAIFPDGTLVLQNVSADSKSSCLIQWWPGLARPAR